MKRLRLALRRWASCAVVLALLLASTPVRAELAENVRERWTFLLQHLVHENVGAASALIAELKQFKKEHGIRDLFPEAELIHAMGVQAQGREGGLGARSYFELARDLAPDLPGPWFRLGLLDLLESDSKSRLVDAGRSFGEGLRALARNPESALRAGIEAVFFGLALLLGVIGLFALFLFVKYLRLVTVGLAARFGDRIPSPALVIPVVNVLLIPFLAWGSLLLTAALVLALGVWVGEKRERRWSAVLLVLLGLAPGLTYALRLTLVLPDLPAVRLYRCELGVCPPAALDALQRTADAPKPWLLKVRGDYLSRNFRGDGYIFESAREAYSTAMKADLKDPALWVNFGNLLVAGRRYAPERVGEDALGQAVLLYDRALQVLGEDARVLSNKAAALDEQGDEQGSARLAERARALDPDAFRERDEVVAEAKERPRAFNHLRDLFPFVSSPTRVVAEMVATSSLQVPRVKNRLFGELDEAGFLLGWGLVVVAGALLAFGGRGRPRSHYCPSCGNVVVPRKAGSSPREICSTCFYQGVKGTYMEPREAVLFEIRQRSRRRWLVVGAVFANLAVPGLGLLMRRRVATGLFFAGLFLAEVLLLAGRPRWLAEPVLWPARDVAALRMILLGVLLCTYVLAQVLLLPRSRRRHGAVRPPTDPVVEAVSEPPPSRSPSVAKAPTFDFVDDDEVRALKISDDVPRSLRVDDDKFLEDL